MVTIFHFKLVTVIGELVHVLMQLESLGYLDDSDACFLEAVVAKNWSQLFLILCENVPYSFRSFYLYDATDYNMHIFGGDLQVQNVIEKPENDHLPLIEASRLVTTLKIKLMATLVG